MTDFKQDYKYNGKRFKIGRHNYIVTATIVAYDRHTQEAYPAVIYKNEFTNKMYCVSIERIAELLNEGK